MRCFRFIVVAGWLRCAFQSGFLGRVLGRVSIRRLNKPQMDGITRWSCDSAVGLVVVAHALRAGQHRVVVGQHGAARHPGAELLRVDAGVNIPVCLP